MPDNLEKPQQTFSLPDGQWLSGQFIGTSIQRGSPRQDGGVYPDKFIVSILSGTRSVQVEYKDEGAARAAFGGAMPTKLDRVLIPIGVRSAKGYTFFFGRIAE